MPPAFLSARGGAMALACRRVAPRVHHRRAPTARAPRDRPSEGPLVARANPSVRHPNPVETHAARASTAERVVRRATRRDGGGRGRLDERGGGRRGGGGGDGRCLALATAASASVRRRGDIDAPPATSVASSASNAAARTAYAAAPADPPAVPPRRSRSPPAARNTSLLSRQPVPTRLLFSVFSMTHPRRRSGARARRRRTRRVRRSNRRSNRRRANHRPRPAAAAGTTTAASSFAAYAGPNARARASRYVAALDDARTSRLAIFPRRRPHPAPRTFDSTRRATRTRESRDRPSAATHERRRKIRGGDV